MGAIVTVLLTSVCLIVAIVVYALSAMGLQTIAQRRCLKNAWMAWLPIGNMWLLGAVSDQYQKHAKGQKRARRISLLLTGLAIVIATLVFAVFAAAMFAQVRDRVMEVIKYFERELKDFAFEEKTYKHFYNHMIDVFDDFKDSLTEGNKDLLDFFVGLIGGTFVLSVLIAAASLVNCVLSYVALYDLYTSCNPETAVICLCATILFPVLLPVFLMNLREKDDGMPETFRSAIAARSAPVRPVSPAAQPPAQTQQNFYTRK